MELKRLFNGVVATFDKNKQTDLLSFLDKWSKFYRWKNSFLRENDQQKIVSNLKNELFLPERIFADLLNFLLDPVPRSIESRLIDLRNHMRSNWQTTGGEIMKYPDCCATIIVKDLFKDRLLDEYGFESAYADTFCLKDPASYLPEEKEIILKASTHLIWLTWDEHDEEEPFYCLEEPLTVDKMVKSFALQDWYATQDLLLFYFTAKSARKINFNIFRPTWCDADFFDKFSPPDPDLDKENKWGLTNPNGKVRHKTKYRAKRPEGVVKSGYLKINNLKSNPKTISYE